MSSQRTPPSGTFEQLDGKKSPWGREWWSSADSRGLLTLYGVHAERSFDAPVEAAKATSWNAGRLIFVGGAPVPAFETLDHSFHSYNCRKSARRAVYQKTIAPAVYPWAGEAKPIQVPQ
jgi:hypothetical protein